MFRVKATNFLTFKELDFDFANRGLCLIEGQNKDEALFKSNGSGKTNLVDALCWGLYGKSLKGKSPDKVVNIQEDKNCCVEVWWGNYHVIRYRKHTKFKNDVQLLKNDEDQTAKSNRNTQDLIDEAIGLSYESFINSIYFQQNTVSTFANAKDSEQKAIIEDLLNLGILTIAQEVCKDEVKKFNNVLGDVQNKYNILQIQDGEINNRIANLNQKAIQFDKQKQVDCLALHDQLQNLQLKKNEQGEVVDIEELKAMVETVAPFREEIKTMENRLLDINVQKRKIQKIEQDYMVQSRMADNAVERLKNTLDLKRKEDPKTCSVCGQPTNGDVLMQQIALLEAQLEEAIECRNMVAKPAVSTDELDAEYKSLTKQITSKRELVEMGEQLKQQILAEQYRRKEIESLDARIADVQKQLESTLSRTNPYTEQSLEEQKKLNDVLVKRQEYQIQMYEIIHDRSYFEYWVDGLANSKLKSYIMDSITPILNERANYYSQFLTGGAFQIEISTITKLKSGELRDKFSVNIHSSSNADYDLSSGGEKKRIDLIVILALQSIVASRAKFPLNLLICDEVAENLDEIGVERLLELLKALANEKGSVFYITHNEEMKPLFPNSITVIKQYGISRVEA